MWRLRHVRYICRAIILFLLTRVDGLGIQDLFLRDFRKGGERWAVLFSICDSAGVDRSGVRISSLNICTAKVIHFGYFLRFCVYFCDFF